MIVSTPYANRDNSRWLYVVMLPRFFSSKIFLGSGDRHWFFEKGKICTLHSFVLSWQLFLWSSPSSLEFMRHYCSLPTCGILIEGDKDPVYWRPINGVLKPHCSPVHFINHVNYEKEKLAAQEASRQETSCLLRENYAT